MEITINNFSCSFVPWRPEQGRVFDFYSFDTETTDIDEQRPHITPCFVLGAACDGQRGVFIPREHVPEFFQAHAGVPFVCHNAPFDLRVIDPLLRPSIDIYQAVDQKLVWDTMVLNRLLSVATDGHTARGESSLANCAQSHLGVSLDKNQLDNSGKSIRLSFGQFLGKPPQTIPADYLRYLAMDALTTIQLFHRLQQEILAVLNSSINVFGFVSLPWLQHVYTHFGPLTHHIQLRSAILMDAMNTTGIGIDQQRRDIKLGELQALNAEYRERLRRAGYLPGQKGSGKALQAIIRQRLSQHPSIEMKRTPSGEKYSTAEEDLAELSAVDPFFEDYTIFRHTDKLLSTYLRKMNVSRLYPKFGYLAATGRTYCGGGFNLQNLPKEKELLDQDAAAVTVRGTFVPAQDHVFIDADFGQIELVVLAFVLAQQMRFGSSLADLINSGNDVHRLIAAAVLDKSAADVTTAERNSAKPVSFGRPGGMAANTLQTIAKNNYGLDLDLAAVEERIAAYHRLVPELDKYLEDEVDRGKVIARILNLTPYDYYRNARAVDIEPSAVDLMPAGWLGGMLLKVLREPCPITNRGNGRPYTVEELDYLWQKAQELPLALAPRLKQQLDNRQASIELWAAVNDWAGRRAVFTVTGRLRANTAFCASRNTLFQGAAADGAILGLWNVWRGGHRIVAFIHDQVVVEAPRDERINERVADVESRMIAGMHEVIPGMRVLVETVVTRSLNKADREHFNSPDVPAVFPACADAAQPATSAALSAT